MKATINSYQSLISLVDKILIGKPIKLQRGDAAQILWATEKMQTTAQDVEFGPEALEKLKKLKITKQFRGVFNLRLAAIARNVLNFSLISKDATKFDVNYETFLAASEYLKAKESSGMPNTKERELTTALDSSTLKIVADFLKDESLPWDLGAEQIGELHQFADYHLIRSLNLKLTANAFIRNSPEVIGPEKWEEWDGNKIPESEMREAVKALPENILEIFLGDCQIFPEKKTREKQLLIYIPDSITYDKILEIATKLFPQEGLRDSGLIGNKSGFPKIFSSYEDMLRKSTPRPGRWALFTKDVIPDSVNKNDYQQQKLLKKIEKKGLFYCRPSLLEAIVCNFAHYFNTGQFLFSNLYTRTDDGEGCIGNFDSHGLDFETFRTQDLAEDLGMAAITCFYSDEVKESVRLRKLRPNWKKRESPENQLDLDLVDPQET